MPLPARRDAYRVPSRRARSTRVTANPLRLWTFLLPLLAPAVAIAGPPYLTDDPQPTDPGHWEIYNFVQSTVGYGALLGETGLELNYWGAKGLQLTAVLPVGF